MSNLKHREIDIADITEPEIKTGQYARQPETSKFVAGMRTDHPSAAEKRLKLRDLIDQVIILPKRGFLPQKTSLTEFVFEDSLSL